ncbi:MULTISPECIES: DUF3165 family protein [Streptococcus]|uniref:DUF3165 family protein n=1 Tax=Streptococcus porcorum TaxID=701526 RepID=A0ABV2JEQ8_9STRE|nr:DUF3165 family protein [Streptococcus sp.]MDY3824818.1 DUF3165 family protein [Streptococcus sp.]
MSYLILALLIVVYYVFAAPKTVKSTMNVIAFVGLCASLLVLGGLSLVKLVQSPPEIFIGFAMTILAYFVILDISKLPKRDKSNRR